MSVMSAPRTRREFLALAGAAGLLTACGSGPAAAPPAAAGWSFTDDRGVRVDLPARPTRVAAYVAPGAALISFGVRPVALFGGPRDDGLLDGVDAAGIASAGDTYGLVDVEFLAAQGTELVVTAFDPEQTGAVFGFTDEAGQGDVEAIAPIVALDGTRDPAAVIERFGELAAALGADPGVAAPDRDRFTAARDAVRAALAGKPGLTAVALLADPAQGVYFVRPEASPNTRQLRELGLDLVSPASPVTDDSTTSFFETASLEEIGRYPADLILLDRTTPEDLAAIPTWAVLPAAQADQVASSSSLIKWTYAQQAEELEGLAAAVRSADAGLVG